MLLTLISKKEEAQDVVTLTFQSDEIVAWEPGQYMHYVLPHENADDRGEERWFTIASAPHEGEIRITTRNSGDKASSFKKALFALPIGGTIEANGPEGDFTVADPSLEFVFIAGGIGITPFHSILLDLDKKGAALKGKLFYANRDTSIVFKDDLDALAGRQPGLKINYVIDPERVDEEYIRAHVPDLKTPIFYLSGPEPMVKALEQTLLSMAIPAEHIKLDDFPGYDWPLK